VIGIDASNGRFLPWWFRNEDGSLGLDKLVDVDDQKTLSTGVRASEYYLHRSCGPYRERARSYSGMHFKSGSEPARDEGRTGATSLNPV
jgi:hypothetical protein